MKPCPFCGADDPNFKNESGHLAPTPTVVCDEKAYLRWVECEVCGARGPVAADWEEVVRLWDDRRPRPGEQEAGGGR